MRDRTTKSILTTRLDPETRELVREAGRGKVHLTIVEEDGRHVAEIRPVESARPSDIWLNYDPERARRAWQESAGVLQGVDVEALLADLKGEREQDSAGRPVW